MRESSPVFAVSRLKLLAVLVLFLFFSNVSAQRIEHYNSPLYSPKTYDPTSNVTSNGLPPTLKNVGIEQRLNEQVPVDAVFKDENGREVKLGEYFGKGRPAILALVYFECPMLCNEVLNGLTGTLKGLSLDVGKDFDVIAISFDARENDLPELAKNKRESYLKRYGRAGSENGWHFLTGTQAEIDKVTKAVGFNYAWDEESKQFAHAGGIMVTTPEGRLSRYLYGIDYAPKDVKFALMESADGKIGGAAEQLMLYCYHYDPSTGKYGLSILRVLRVAGVVTLLGLSAMILAFWVRNKSKDELAENE
ncbi:MAG: SCO family protein [Acidobacteria bacterium]|nr:SCO family protein [Acidobacteriota bacterium]MBK8147592.1 SCO family protein [Acidobacteriota bacterium]